MFSSALTRPLLPAALAVLALSACSTAAQNDDDQNMDGMDDMDGMGTPDIARIASGVVEGTDIFVATVYEDDRAIAYFCGGPSTYDTHTHWFAGEPSEDGTFDLAMGDVRVTGEADADGASGTLVDAMGTEHTFTTKAPSADSIEGLYTIDVTDDCRAGVVVANDGGQTQAQGVYFCEDEGLFVQVIILEPALTADGGMEVDVELPEGMQTLTVQPF